MPRSALFALLLALCAIAVGDWYASRAPQRSEAVRNAHCADQTRNGATIGAGPLSKDDTSANKEGSQKEPGPLEILTFLTLVLSAGLLWWQSSETRRSAEASERSALASERALKDLETPWLVADIPHQNVFGPLQMPPSTNFPDRVTVAATLRIANFGRSPAWVTYSSVNFRFFDDADDEDQLRGDPPYLHMTRSESFALGSGDPLERGYSRQLERFHRSAIEEGRGRIVLFGVVGYTDLFGREDEMRFSFMWSRDVPLPRLQMTREPVAWHRPRMRPGDTKARATEEDDS